MDLPLATVLNSLEDAVLCLDENATVLWLNEAGARQFGCDQTLAAGRPASSLPGLAEVLKQLDLGELTRSRSTRLIRRVQLSRPGSEPAAFEAVVTRLEHEQGQRLTVVFRDVGLLLDMEKAVYESRQAQALAALSDGIAHDFNNILTAVISQIDLALHAPEFPPSLREHLIYAQTSARRGAELVSRLQIFGQQAKPKFEPLNLVDVVEQAVFVLKRSIDPKIAIVCPAPAQTLWFVHADAHQIIQTLLNLAINARDAMPRGGQITFELANHTFPAAATRPPRQPGEFVRLTVRDTGQGMSPEVARRVFEPYFTTKDRSRGPGLGLSMAAAVVAEHSGWMEVESRPGQGSIFSLFLPRATEPAVAPKLVAVPDAKPTEGKECILIADDEELVRLVTKAVLAYRGYRVIEAEDGQDAVEKYTANAGSIDLVLMDMHMPRLNGYDALVRIRRINPRAPVIMLSGGVHDPEAGIADLEGAAFLHKPFENQELVRLVRQLLDAK